MRRLLALVFLMPLSVWASYSCDGNDDKLEYAATPPVTDYPFTMAGWVKLNSTGNFSHVMGIVGNSNNYHMMLTDTGDNFDGQTRITGTPTTANNAGTFSGTSTWHHVVIIGTSTSSGTITTYFDGSSNTASAVPGASLSVTPDTIRFCTDDNGFNDANVKVGYFAIWTSALSTTDVDALAGGANPCTYSTAPAACWPMTADANDTIASYDLTVTGATLDSGDNPTITSGIAPIAQQRQQMQQ